MHFRGYEYEVQVEPLKDVYQDQSISKNPTGGYPFLGVHRKKASNSFDEQKDLVKKENPEMNIVLNTEPEPQESYSGFRYILDVALVLDSSYTITSVGWINLKEAAKKLIDGLDISPEGTHVAIMKFSTDVETYFMFSPDEGKDKLKTKIDGLTYDGQWSRLDTALKAVDHHVFVPIGGARLENVPKAVVIFSDGKADGPSRPDEDINWQQKTAEPIHSLKRKNVQIFVVAAGETDEVALQSIAGDPARIFDMDNIDQLVEALKDVSQKIPIVPPVIPSSQVCEKVTVTVTVTETPSSKSISTKPSVETPGTHTVTQTVTSTKSITSTPVTTVMATETTTALLTATETASPLIITATKTNTLTETFTATATELLTSTAMSTITATLTANTTSTEVVTLTTTLGVTSTTYANVKQTPIAFTIMAGVAGKKKRNAPNDHAERWYKNYIPKFIKTWMAIEE